MLSSPDIAEVLINIRNAERRHKRAIKQLEWIKTLLDEVISCMTNKEVTEEEYEIKVIRNTEEIFWLFKGLIDRQDATLRRNKEYVPMIQQLNILK